MLPFREEQPAPSATDNRGSTGCPNVARPTIVKLTTAHKILIGSAVVFFAGYGVWELVRYLDSGAQSSLIAGVLALGGTAGLAIYLRSFLKTLP